MASKSFRNIISVIAMANGIALVIKQATSAKTPNALADKLDHECTQAFKLWPGSIEKGELNKIYARLAEFERAAISELGRPELLTSIALGLLDDLNHVIKDPVKRSALERVESCLERIHDYYDRRGDRWEIYEAANKAIELWNCQN
jgi:hypothetical protein